MLESTEAETNDLVRYMFVVLQKNDCGVADGFVDES